MKYTININQRIIAKHHKSLDLKDAAILDYIRDFIGSGGMREKMHDGDVYYWVKYSAIRENMPLLKIKKDDAIYRRFKKMIRENILIAHPYNQANGETYFARGKHFRRLFFASVKKTNETDFTSVEKPNGFGLKNERTSVKKTNGLRFKNRTDYTINNKTIIDKTIKSKKGFEKQNNFSLNTENKNENPPNSGRPPLGWLGQWRQVWSAEFPEYIWQDNDTPAATRIKSFFKKKIQAQKKAEGFTSFAVTDAELKDCFTVFAKNLPEWERKNMLSVKSLSDSIQRISTKIENNGNKKNGNNTGDAIDRILSASGRID